MSADIIWRFPFHDWTGARLAAALEQLQAASPDVGVELDEDDDAVVFTRGPHGARVHLVSDDAEDSCAYAMLEAAQVHPALFEEVNEAFDGLLGAICEPEGAEFDRLCREADRADALLWAFDEVSAWLAVGHEVDAEDDELLTLVWSWAGTERTQLVFVETVDHLHQEWLQISSRAAPADRVDPRRLLEMGGLANARIEDDAVWFAIVVPFGLSGTELEAMIDLVATLADDLELEVLGTDDG